MSTNQKPSTRGKKKRMWNNIPVYMVEKFRGEISNLHEDNAFWILVFTLSDEDREKIPRGEKWNSQVWIYNVEKEAWESKIIFGNIGASNGNNSLVDHYFYQHEHQRLIVTGREFHCVAVYSFQGELIGEYRFDYPVDMKRIIWRMPDKDTLYLYCNPYKYLEKFDLKEKKKYRYTSAFVDADTIAVNNIAFYPQQIDENLYLIIVESAHGLSSMWNMIFYSYGSTLQEGSENALRLSYDCVRLVKDYHISLPKHLFPNILELTWNSQQLNIPGMEILPFGLFKHK